ncbi:zinc finger, CCHC-type containing protein [Tanacetum coccineum]
MFNASLFTTLSNGIAKGRNSTLKEMVTAMLISSGMSQDMWGEAILTATYLLNKIPRKEKEETPYEYGTRPDLAYAVSRLSRYTSNPSYGHWKAITRVLHYLRYSRDYGLHYDRHPAVIEGYSDANWISDIKEFLID